MPEASFRDFFAHVVFADSLEGGAYHSGFVPFQSRLNHANPVVTIPMQPFSWARRIAKYGTNSAYLAEFGITSGFNVL